MRKTQPHGGCRVWGWLIETQTVWFIVAYVLMGLGLIGAVVPLIPGPLLIWVGAFIWAWVDHFHRVGWAALLILGLLAILAMASDLLATTITGRRAGLGWRTIGGAIAGGIVGGSLLSVLPVFGTILGAIVGALLGVVLMEYTRVNDWKQAMQAARVYAVGFLVGRILELVLCLVMIGVFVWSIFI